jgi:uncharacterized membrane protein (UPF0182 family)
MRSTLPEAIDALADPEADTVDQIEEDPDAAVAQASQGDATSGEGAEPSGTPVAPPAGDVPGDLASMSNDQLAAEALQTLKRAEQAQQDGDWEVYGQEQERLRQILQIMAGEGATPASSPEAGD